jgi:hypothetical protein
MKNKIILPKFYFLLRDVSQKGIDPDTQTLQKEYDKFVLSLFQYKSAITGKPEYRNALVYTRVELQSLIEVSKKKYGNLFI